jgi:hypothetical protein
LLKKRLLFAVFIVLVSCIETSAYAENEVEDHWWSGVTFTPGIGLRHLGLDVTRKSDGFQANIAQDVAAKFFFSFSISSPEYQFGHPNIGISLRSYSSFVTLDHQFVDSQIVNSTTGANSGDRIDVGTEVTGYYSYVVPAVHWKGIAPSGGIYKAALGLGLWTAKLSGDVALTPNNQPDRSTPKSKITLQTKNQIAYLFFMSYETKTGWLYEMTVGGPKFEDSEYDYQVEEVSLIVGKTFTL